MRKTRLTVVIAIFVLLLGGVGFFVIRAVTGPSLTPAQIAARAAAERARILTAAEKKAVRVAEKSISVTLPTKPRSAVPTEPAGLFTKPLGSRQVVSFVPYYTLSDLSSADFADTSDLSYFGLQVAKGGAITKPAEFVDLDTSQFAQFTASAHAASDQVLLTLSAFSRSSIDSIARHPTTIAASLVSQVAPLLHTYDLQGIDLDIEGRWQADRKGFTTFVQTFAASLETADPGRLLVVDTFPQSAADPSSDFFNLKKLAPLVNDFFIMEYAMQNANYASASSPAISPSLGLSSAQTLIQYTKVVSPSKLILGLPFYGFDFATESSRPGAMANTSDPVAVTYQAVQNAARPAYWDPVSETPYTLHQEGTQWHETWFDNPLSIALKVALANDFHTVGTGVWTLGMEGGDQQMLSALDGGSPPKKTALAPTSAAT